MVGLEAVSLAWINEHHRPKVWSAWLVPSWNHYNMILRKWGENSISLQKWPNIALLSRMDRLILHTGVFTKYAWRKAQGLLGVQNHLAAYKPHEPIILNKVFILQYVGASWIYNANYTGLVCLLWNWIIKCFPVKSIIHSGRICIKKWHCTAAISAVESFEIFPNCNCNVTLLIKFSEQACTARNRFACTMLYARMHNNPAQSTVCLKAAGPWQQGTVEKGRADRRGTRIQLSWKTPAWCP